MPETIRFVASAACGVETAANRHALDSNASPLTDAVAECEFRPESAAGIDVDAKLVFAVCQ